MFYHFKSNGFASLQTVFLKLQGFGLGFTREGGDDMGLEIAMILLAGFFRFGKIIVNININIGKNAKK